MRIKYIESKDSRVLDFNKLISGKFPRFLTENNPEVILVAGGDGAMLHAIQDNVDFQGIFFGKAMGTLNFLMNSFENDIEILQELIEGKREINSFLTKTISVSVNNVYVGEAVNDVIIGDSINSYFSFEISSTDKYFDAMKLKGTGLCFSTPLGSTAFNFNNHGMILPLESSHWSVTSVVCNKYIKDIIDAQEVKIKANCGGVYLSGIEKLRLQDGDELKLNVGKTVKLGILDNSEFQKKRVDLAHRYRN